MAPRNGENVDSEYDILLPKGEPECQRNDSTPEVSKTKLALVVTALTVVVVGTVGAFSENLNKGSRPPNEYLRSPAFNQVPDLLTFKVTTSYGEARYGTEHPFVGDKFVTEPHKPMTFTAYGSAAANAHVIRWEIGGGNGMNDVLLTDGSAVEAMFTIPGTQTVKMIALDSDGSTLAEHESDVVTAYVKRELRQLNDHDREAFLDAAITLWKTPTAAGRELYGESYTGMDKFVQVHADSATGDVKCDHWHEGTGFLTHHLALSLSFEASVRAVNPAVTTPYWDFTIDGEAIKIRGGGPSMLTQVNDFFTAKWFGDVDGQSHVIDGRWAHADAVMYNGGLLKNSYNIIRAPWNNNPDMELTRHMFDVCGQEPVNKPIPTCQVHAAVANKATFGELQSTIAGWGHGTLHVNTGGVFGECTTAMADLYTKYNKELSEEVTMMGLGEKVKTKFGVDPGWSGEDKFPLQDFVIDAFHLEYFHIYRTLWRSQTCAADGQALALNCPEACDLDVPQAECKCTCKGVERDDFDWENIEPCMYMQDKTQWITQSALPREFRKDLVTTFCSAGVLEGEQLESASPMDIIFWMIHPVLDRLVTAKRLSSLPGSTISMGTYGKIVPFQDETWKSFSSYSTEDYTCVGHGPDDEALNGLSIMPRLALLADTDGNGVVSNMELYKAMDPTTMGVDYVFDNYKWDHCGQKADLSEADLEALHTESYASAALRPQRGAARRGLKGGFA